MKYRIIECKTDDGELCYKVQKKVFFSWKDYKFDHGYQSSLWNINCVENILMVFETPEFAERILNHSLDVKEYKGKVLYPCVMELGVMVGYYCPWLSERHEYGIDYKIIGSEEHCKEDIDYWIEREENSKYKKVCKLITH